MLTRRGFLETGALAVAGSAFAAPVKKDKLNMAFIGTGGRGHADLDEFYKIGERVVALCDVDLNNLNGGYNLVKEKWPDARRYQDWRTMLEKERDLDAVVIATPDHMHAITAIAAMRKGCAVYVEKPLVRTVWEAQEFARVAKEAGVMTQMGNNGNGTNGQRRFIEIMQAGVLGEIKEIHQTTDRPIWPQALDRPAGSDPIPAHLNWDEWLGVAPERPFKSGVYHSFKWRGWYDFGTGALGDIACHALSALFRALKLTDVISVETVATTPRFKETYQAASTVKIVVRSAAQKSPVTIYWYDGKTGPKPEICPEALGRWGSMPINGGRLIIGTNGIIRDGAIKMNDEKDFHDFNHNPLTRDVPQSLPRVQGHHWEFAQSIRGGDTPLSHYDHAVPLTTMVLLGCISQRVEGRLDWDPAANRFTNSEEANKLLKPIVRDGWKIS